MGFPAQPAQPTRGVDIADVGADAFQGGEGAALGFNFAEDVFADTGTEVGGRAGEPPPFFVQQVRGHPLGFVAQVGFVAPGLVERADGFVDLFTAHGTAGLEPVGGGELAAGGLLGGQKVAEENVAVREGFFHDEGVRGVVVQRVAEGGGFGGALCGVVVACGLDDLAEFAVGASEARVGLLDMHLIELHAKIGFSETEGWSQLAYVFESLRRLLRTNIFCI